MATTRATDEARRAESETRAYFCSVGSRLGELDDWSLNLLGELTFRNGRDRSPTDPSLPTSTRRLAERIGSSRQSGSAAVRTIRSAAKELEIRGMLARERSTSANGYQDGPRTPYVWQLLTPSSPSIELPWSAACEFVASLFRRRDPFPGGPRVRAAACRLALVVGDDRRLSLTRLGWAELLGGPTPLSRATAEKRLGQLKAANCGLADVRRERIEGNLLITVELEPIEQELPIRDQAVGLYRALWHQELVEKLISDAGSQLSTGKISLKRRINGFYRPVLALQEQHSAPLLRYALEETDRAGILGKPRNQNWHRYAATVCQNNAKNYEGRAVRQGLDNAVADQLQAREMATRSLLARAGQLNGSGQAAEARALLGEILDQAAELSELFDGDLDRCQRSLREAFKQGTSDFVGIGPKPHGLDFDPEWSWNEPVRL